MIRIFILSFFLFTYHLLQAQVLFSYGPHKISMEEFQRAFQKNNTGKKDEKAIREYLELYLRFKLKVQAAKDLRMDTLPGIKNDVAGFRAQVADQYMKKQVYSKQMIEEAYERSLTEIEAAHIFIAYGEDSAQAKKRIDSAYQELQKGSTFSVTSRNYSTDPYVKATDGYLDYITVFSLPYSLETIVYSLKPGSFSTPVAGSKGWHIFQVLQKRKASGRLLASQILLGIPPNASQEERSAIMVKADSIYGLLQKGYSFEEAAQKWSQDKVSFQNGGVLPEFGYTDADPVFAKAAFGLKKDGDITAPFQTEFGWHIVKRTSLNTTPKGLSDPETLQNWTDKINGSPRSKIIEEKHRDEMSKAVVYKPLVYDKAALWVLSDSVLVSTQYTNLYKSNRKKYLFQFSDKQVSTEDWLKFVKNKQSLTGGGSLNGWEELMKEFTENTIEQHYKDRLEKMNPEFRWQMQEFTEGSLLFEVMEKSIWSKAPTDTSGLMSYYEQNRSKYVWEKSADAIIFNCADTSVAFKVKQQVEKDFSKWKTYMEQQGGYALADSGRFELTQLPATEALQNLQPAMTTSVQSNSGDGSASFCYIIRLYPDKEPRQFEAAKGLVINDYQQVLEEKWISSLKKKYPVVIQEDNLKKLFR